MLLFHVSEYLTDARRGDGTKERDKAARTIETSRVRVESARCLWISTLAMRDMAASRTLLHLKKFFVVLLAVCACGRARRSGGRLQLLLGNRLRALRRHAEADHEHEERKKAQAAKGSRRETRRE